MGVVLSFPVEQVRRGDAWPDSAAEAPTSVLSPLVDRTAAQSVAAAAAALRAAHADCLSTMTFNKACHDAIATGDLELMKQVHAELSQRLTIDRDGRPSINWLDLPAIRPRA